MAERVDGSNEEQPRPTFPAVDQPTQRPGIGTVRELITPGEEVPARRAQKRASIGVDGEPIIEIDVTGTVLYVGGDWLALVGFTKPGPAALDALLSGVAGAEPEQVQRSISTAITERTASVWEHKSLSSLPFLKIVPIPSANHGNVMHALVGLSSSATIDQAVEPLSMARHRVTGRS